MDPRPHESAAQNVPAQDEPAISSLSVLVARVFWSFLGPVLLALAAYHVATHRGWFTAFDGFFGGVVVIMLLSRWIEQRSGEGSTLSGRRSNWADFRNYGLVLVIAASLVWAGTNIYSNVLRA